MVTPWLELLFGGSGSEELLLEAILASRQQLNHERLGRFCNVLTRQETLKTKIRVLIMSTIIMASFGPFIRVEIR